MANWLLLVRLAGSAWFLLTGGATAGLGRSNTISNLREKTTQYAYAFGYNYTTTTTTTTTNQQENCQEDSTTTNQQDNCQEDYRERARRHHRDLQIGFPSEYLHNPRAGTIKVLVLLIQFSDHTNDRTLVSKEFIETTFKGVMKDWFQVNSHGIYSIDPVVTDWMVTDNTESYYADGQRGFHPGFKKAMFPALDALDQDPSWNWQEYDNDNDGMLDSVVVMHSGISALVSAPDSTDGKNLDCFGVNPFSDRIWPHAFVSSRSDETWYNEAETVRLNGYTVNSVYDSFCDDVPLTPGLTLHEYMHTMDTIDLYDFDFSAKGCGFWDIMSHPYGADNSGTPGLLGAWTKYVVGWLEPTQIKANGDYVSHPAHTHPEAYLIDLTQPDAPAREYLLIENRQPIGFEEPIDGAGLLIWHVDDDADGMKNPGFPGQAGWPQNGNHYMVAILPKDGEYDLEKNKGYGDAGDLWIPGDVLGPGNGNTVFPNTDSYQGGTIIETGITIEVLTQEDTGDISFRVSGLKGDSSTTTDEPSATPAPTVAAAATAATEPPAAPVQGPESDGGDTTTTPKPLPEYVSATVAPAGTPAEPPRWILSRPPAATRPPFVLPEMPYMKPPENINEDAEDDSNQTSSSCCPSSMWIGSMVRGMLSTFLFQLLL